MPRPRGDANETINVNACNQIAHCLIYRQDDFYGFAEPYFIHRTLKDLVLHYRETSLFEHNDELDTTLRMPIGMIESPMSYSARPSSIQQVINNNNNNTHGNVYSAVIMTTRSLREFTRFI